MKTYKDMKLESKWFFCMMLGILFSISNVFSEEGVRDQGFEHEKNKEGSSVYITGNVRAAGTLIQGSENDNFFSFPLGYSVGYQEFGKKYQYGIEADLFLWSNKLYATNVSLIRFFKTKQNEMDHNRHFYAKVGFGDVYVQDLYGRTLIVGFGLEEQMKKKIRIGGEFSYYLTRGHEESDAGESLGKIWSSTLMAIFKVKFHSRKFP